MDIYFDKANSISFLQNKDSDNFSDCLRVLKRKLNCYFNFSKADIQKNESLTALFKLFAEGVGTTEIKLLDTTFPNRPLKTNSYLSFNLEQLSSAYLLDDEKVVALKSKGAVLIGEVGEELSLISTFFLQNGDYKFDRKLKIGGDQFSNWRDLEKFQFETSDILIFDPYILCDQNSIDSNLIPLLKVLSTKSFCKINLIIYTQLEDGHLTYEEVKGQVKETISTSTGVKSTFTLIRYRDIRDVKSPQAEHDRTIFTNYSRLYSGDTFNYWNKDGSKRTKGRELHIASYADKENHDLAKELISDIQKNIDSLPPEFIEGDRKSNFLNFT